MRLPQVPEFANDFQKHSYPALAPPKPLIDHKLSPA